MPATLTLFQNGQELKKYEITKDRVIIGRVPENDITLDNPTVSRKHMAIVKMGDAYQLQDLGSSSGTYVNGKKIASYFLNDGDEISVGQMVLRFALPAPPQEGDSEMTMVVTNEDIKKQLQMMHQAALAKGPGAPPAPAAPTAPPKPPEPPKVEAPPPPPKPPEPPKVEAPPPPKPPEPPKVEAPPPPKPPEPPKVEAPPPPKPPEPPKVEAPPPPKPPEPPKIEAPPPPKPPAPPKLELPPPPKPPAPPKIEASAPPKPPEPPKIEAPPPPKPPAPPKLEPPAPPKAPAPPAAEAPASKPIHPKTELVSISGNPQPKPSESALLATVRGPFLGGQAKLVETNQVENFGKEPAAPKPPEPPKPPAPPKAAPPPPPPNVPMDSFEPTLISPPRSAPVAPAGQPAAAPVPRTPDGKPDIAAIAFDAGVTVSPAAIGGFNALSSQPNVPKPPQTPPAPGVIPTPVPPVQAPPKAPEAGAGGDIPVDQLLTPKHKRAHTQAIQAAPVVNPAPTPANPPTLPPSPPPVPPPIPQTQAPQPAVQPAVQAAVPMFAKPAAGSWGTTPPPQPVTDDERLWGMLANILGLFCWIGPILGLVLRPKSNFVKFHSLQYLFMAIAFTIVWFPVAWIVSFVTLMIHPILYFIWLGVSLLISLAMLILVVLMALKANQGMLFKLPFLGQITYNLVYGKS